MADAGQMRTDGGVLCTREAQVGDISQHGVLGGGQGAERMRGAETAKGGNGSAVSMPGGRGECREEKAPSRGI